MRLLTLILLSLALAGCTATARPTHHLTWSRVVPCPTTQPTDLELPRDPECTDPEQEAERT